MNKELKIIPPKGYEVDTEHSTFECIRFKPIESIKSQLYKTWKEFCENTPIKIGESWIDSYGQVKVNRTDECHRLQGNRNILPSKDLAEAVLALCQLIQLRDCYNQGWKPNWKDNNESKYTIYLNYDSISIGRDTTIAHILAFKTMELRDNFFENFKVLIEVAKPLL